MRQVVQTLQLALEKEKSKVNDLKEQVCPFLHGNKSNYIHNLKLFMYRYSI